MDVTSPSQDILKRFPYEVWSKCILDAIYRAPEGPLPFLDVSSYWQTLLLDSPEMWSYIHIDGEDIAARVHLFLHLSREHPLDVALDMSDQSWASVRVAILAHCERIRYIYLLSWPHDSSNEAISQMLGKITFPAVRTIEAEVHRDNARSFRSLFALCPMLQYPDMASFHNEEDFKSIPDLVGFRSMRASVSGINAVLSITNARAFISLPKLEELDLILKLSYHKLEQCPPDAFVLSSTSVRDLALETDHRTVLRGVLSSSLSELSSLYISVSLNDLDVLINGLRSLPSLRKLQLNITAPSGETLPTVFPSLWPLDIPRLRDLNIVVSTESRASFNSVLRVFTEYDAILGVETFDLDISNALAGYIQVSDIPQILHSVRNAENIYLRGFKWFDIDHSANLGFKYPVRMPHLLHLYTTIPVILLIIDAPSLHSLDIISSPEVPLTSLHIPNRLARDIVTLHITGEAFSRLVIKQADHWDSVKNLIWTGDESLIGLNTTTFRSICSVGFFMPRSSGQLAIAHGLNKFLVALLRHPDACPCLRTIKSDKYPAWALITQVLLQRNQNQVVVQLDEIWLPSLPVKPLLSLVVKLLSGSSNEAIPKKIDHIIMRRYQHTLFPECHLCVSAGYINCLHHGDEDHPDDLAIWWEERGDGLKYDRRSDPDYIELLELGLQKEGDKVDLGMNCEEWEVYLNNLDVGWKEAPKRIRSCDRHPWVGGEPMRIHQYMLEW